MGRPMTWLIAYLAAAVTFVVLDLIWLGYVAHGFYKSEMGSLLADNVNIPAAAAFYAIYLAGVLFFAVKPGIEAGNVGYAAVLGALLGFLCYATYDLTSLAVIRDYSVRIAIVDMIWGAVLTACVAAAACAVALRVEAS